MPFLFFAAAFGFVALVVLGVLITALTSLNGYTLLLLALVYYLGRLSAGRSFLPRRKRERA